MKTRVKRRIMSKKCRKSCRKSLRPTCKRARQWRRTMGEKGGSVTLSVDDDDEAPRSRKRRLCREGECRGGGVSGKMPVGWLILAGRLIMTSDCYAT